MANLPPTLDSGGAKENPLRVIFSPLVSLNSSVHLLEKRTNPLQVEMMLAQFALSFLPVGLLGRSPDSSLDFSDPFFGGFSHVKVAGHFLPPDFSSNDFPGGPPNVPNEFLPGSDPLGTKVAGEGGSPIENVMELMHNVKDVRTGIVAIRRLRYAR